MATMRGISFSDFLRTPVMDQNALYRDEGAPSTRPDIKASPLALWVAKVNSYLELREPKVLLNRQASCAKGRPLLTH